MEMGATSANYNRHVVMKAKDNKIDINTVNLRLNSAVGKIGRRNI